MKHFINKVLDEILSGANATTWVAVLLIAYPVCGAWLLYKSTKRKPNPETKEVSKFSFWYMIKDNLPVIIYTTIFMNVFALWTVQNFPAYKVLTLGIVIGLLSTGLGVLVEKVHDNLFNKAKKQIDNIN